TFAYLFFLLRSLLSRSYPQLLETTDTYINPPSFEILSDANSNSSDLYSPFPRVPLGMENTTTFFQIAFGFENGLTDEFIEIDDQIFDFAVILQRKEGIGELEYPIKN